MRKFPTSAWCVAVCLLLAGSDLTACGDKMLRLGSRLGGGQVAAHRASLLIYMPSHSIVPEAAKKLKLQSALTRAGHRVHAVEHAADLDKAVSSGRYDIIIADVATAAARAGTPSASPSVLPLVAKPQWAEAERQFGHFIKAGGRVHEALDEVDHVMESRKAARVAP